MKSVKCCKTCNIFSALSQFRAKMLHLLQHFASEWAVRHKNVAYFATFLTRLGGRIGICGTAAALALPRSRPCVACRRSRYSRRYDGWSGHLPVPGASTATALASPRIQHRDRPSQSPEPTPGHPLVPAPVPSRLHRPLPLFALTDPGHLGSRQLPGALLQLQRDLGADGAIAGAVFGALDQGGVFVNLDFVDAQEHAF